MKHILRRRTRRPTGGPLPDSFRPTFAPALALALALALTLTLTACGDAPESDGMAGEAEESAAASEVEAEEEAAEAELVVVDPWVRTAIAPEAEYGEDAAPVNTAAYLVLRNATATADALVGVETEIADTAEIHTVSMDGGVMRMRSVDSVAVPAGGEVRLEPGGYHVMLIGLRGPVSQGATVDLRLRFRSGRVMAVTAPVLRAPPM